ncbi:hypothetical protein MAR_030771 [Mya arenaria]|uniref:Uncharacterized protein n=1 Tax=Mya arenaria TaxID=6604 RepID=A0ABY7F1V6_MYAAR|nr:hypothetical protein MAR_030771 [Mya arenaria]
MTGLLQLLLLVSVTMATEPSCPACSKYDYEEKVLERMIRMEFAFEKVLKENKAVSKTVEQDLMLIKEENERLHATVDALKDQQEQAERRLDSLMEEVERNQSSTLEKIYYDSNSTLEQTIAAFNNIKGLNEVVSGVASSLQALLSAGKSFLPFSHWPSAIM